MISDIVQADLPSAINYCLYSNKTPSAWRGFLFPAIIFTTFFVLFFVTKTKICTFVIVFQKMKRFFTILIYVAVFAMAGCTGNSTLSDENGEASRIAQPSDTLYTMAAAMEAYASNPRRALQIIDSAEIVGNLTDFSADLLRAKVYAWPWSEINYDSAILIGERLMRHDSILAQPYRQEDVLEILLNACRLRKDYEQGLHWATQLGELYLSQGEVTEALRNDAEIGAFLIRIGQQEEGLAKIDSVICQLDGKRHFNELDASIIALKRKAELCYEKGLYDDMIPAAQHMLNLLSDYEQHPTDYHDGTVREPTEDIRLDYIDFYRGKAYAYLAMAYSSIAFTMEGSAQADARRKAWEHLALYEQTIASQNAAGRLMIASTLGKLGEHDQMLAIYDEMQQQLGCDTLNANYTSILRGRAEAAEAQGRHADANGYWRRDIELTELLNDRLLQSKAHLYAARFHAQEQQREIDRHREATHRAVLSRTMIGFTGLLILFFALYALHQWRKTRRQNTILAQQITEAVEYKEKYKELKRSIEAEGETATTPASQTSDSAEPITPQLTTPTPQPPTPNSQIPPHNSQPDTSHPTDAELFAYLRDLIEREKLFLNPQFERQTLINRTGLSKERIGAAFAQSGVYERFTTYVRELRLDYAVRLMNEQPDLTVEQVCQASGFANADTFTRNFKAKYGMTPTAYRLTRV